MSRLAPRTVRNLILALTLVGGAAACTPTANALPTAPPGAAGSAQTGADASAGTGSPLPSGAITDPAVAWPAFAACLRSHGVQIEDPALDANGDPSWTTDIKKVITEPASADCGRIIAGVISAGDAEQRPRRSFSFDSLVAQATCMREHGLTDWPDPDPNDLAAGMPPGYDKADSAVRAALIACEHLLVETTASPSPGS
jgi:hypothetical protein